MLWRGWVICYCFCLVLVVIAGHEQQLRAPENHVIKTTSQTFDISLRSPAASNQFRGFPVKQQYYTKTTSRLSQAQQAELYTECGVVLGWFQASDM
eukprot:141067-Rhodomonas_salina.2